jgi:hypothetical protein
MLQIRRWSCKEVNQNYCWSRSRIIMYQFLHSSSSSKNKLKRTTEKIVEIMSLKWQPYE